ncbi:uncharacterized protein F5Z01DRAFT_24150 [Emericellopsis atlantica]|uniref:IBR domain-containing protein n=1 Tax=Emericellopsis atlantica TaxID=2614577 RepID=A0A9P7ZVF5_9HYPO|nr:uncharacterized protein F5Z01DRAFT_24150 [Emericellopsis atlantica]KAG9259084.1 hypothetical protein F5Z01DRAFT_24150 [Emericellopsis atlantica]
MCESCLKHKFELACKNPQYMPPTCCTDEAIPYDYVEPLFDTLFKKAFYRTSRDAATPSRLYCPSRSCGEHFVPKLVKSDGVRNSTRCDVCNQKICLSCNSKWHTAPDCQAEAAGPNHARHPRDAGRQRCPPSITTTGNKQYYADRNVADEESESDDDPPVRQFAGRRDARPRVYHAEPTRQRKVQDNYDEDLARQMELDMALEDTDDDNEEYDITVGRVDRDGLGISSGRRRNTHYSHSSGRNRTQPRESPPVHEPGYKTPPRSVYDRGNYVSETGRARGLRSDSFREGSMERRLAQRLSEPRPNAGPPMGFPPGPPHGGPAGMMPQGVPPPPMGPTPYHQPHQMRMPLGSVPLTSSPPMMSSPPHPFGSFPPHPSQAIHYQPPPARSMMSDYDHGGSPRSSTGPRSSSMAGLSSHGGEGKSRVHEWRRHVDVGVAAHEEYTVPATIPEERMISG